MGSAMTSQRIDFGDRACPDGSSTALYHPLVGRLELGMSSYFKWRAMPLLRESQTCYQTSAGLNATWQREDHALELMIRQAIEDMDSDQPPAEPTGS